MILYNESNKDAPRIDEIVSKTIPRLTFLHDSYEPIIFATASFTNIPEKTARVNERTIDKMYGSNTKKTIRNVISRIASFFFSLSISLYLTDLMKIGVE